MECEVCHQTVTLDNDYYRMHLQVAHVPGDLIDYIISYTVAKHVGEEKEDTAEIKKPVRKVLEKTSNSQKKVDGEELLLTETEVESDENSSTYDKETENLNEDTKPGMQNRNLVPVKTSHGIDEQCTETPPKMKKAFVSLKKISSTEIEFYSSVSGDQTNTCKICSKELSRKLSLQMHLKKKHEITISNYEDQYEKGNFDSSKKRQMRRSMKRGQQFPTKSDTKFPCRECEGKNFSNAGNLNRHVRDAHGLNMVNPELVNQTTPKDKIFTCEMCDDEFIEDPKTISIHLETIHKMTIARYAEIFVKENLPEPNSEEKAVPTNNTLDNSKTLLNSALENPTDSRVQNETISSSDDIQGASFENQSQSLKPLEHIPQEASISAPFNSPQKQPEKSVLHETEKVTPKSPTTPIIEPLVEPKIEPGLAPPRPPLITRFLCPVGGCKFSTSKQGMKGGDGARHLLWEHEVKFNNMEPGQYKFRKVKA